MKRSSPTSQMAKCVIARSFPLFLGDRRHERPSRVARYRPGRRCRSFGQGVAQPFGARSHHPDRSASRQDVAESVRSAIFCRPVPPLGLHAIRRRRTPSAALKPGCSTTPRPPTDIRRRSCNARSPTLKPRADQPHPGNRLRPCRRSTTRFSRSIARGSLPSPRRPLCRLRSRSWWRRHRRHLALPRRC